ncbi:flagellar protein FlaG [Chitinilyticum piscinae]|uniref:Flagellar protein FlaG n=1 Tax=Chitinilyticum piscinae TaxID=2866724 RepID=A0A8J7KA31_9NEIS|nr:flagellar protein FlaG [Chitinilyticum piscinae]MBE9608824.1 flagellar protein FlaG [Chitinilyticum piscinae]
MQINSLGSANSAGLPRAEEQLRQASTQSAGVKVSDAVSVARDAVPAVQQAERSNEVAEAVKKINETIKSFNQNVGVEFSTDSDTSTPVVRVIDTTSKEVLRQIPTEEALQIAKAIDRLQGLLVRDKA